MPAIISKGQEPNRLKPAATVTNVFRIRRGKVLGNFIRIPKHHHQPSDGIDHGDTPIAIGRSRLFFAEAERRFGNLCRSAQPGPPRSAVNRNSVSFRNAPILITTTTASASAARVALRPIGLSGAFFSSTSHTTT